jgi:hypothetical protein
MMNMNLQCFHNSRKQYGTAMRGLHSWRAVEHDDPPLIKRSCQADVKIKLLRLTLQSLPPFDPLKSTRWPSIIDTVQIENFRIYVHIS